MEVDDAEDAGDGDAGLGRELMAPRTDRTTRIPSAVASPVTTKHAAKGSVLGNLTIAGNLLGKRINRSKN